MSLGDDESGFEEVQTILDSDLDSFEGEIGELYDEMERYALTADAMDSSSNYSSEDAQYFRELAVETYKSFSYVMQLKKEEEEEI